jgi:predicted TIM-barrel fold metal-dependent hydrolase
MRILDGHIHIHDGEPRPEALLQSMGAAGVEGGVLLSLRPPCFGGTPRSAKERLANLKAWTAPSGGRLVPFFWIDPTERDAGGQVELALEAGVRGFKVICDHFEPGDKRALPVYRKIARSRKPMLFHSGILWDGKPSSRYCRPVLFEALLDVEGLVFALAHISWPWCDELVAVYGKLLNALERGRGASSEMYVDLTPGTPPIYRRDALTRLLKTGYDIEDNLIFGTDCETGSYNAAWAQEWLDRDRGIYDGLGVSAETREKIHGRNLERFLALGAHPGRKVPRPAES